MEPFSLVVVTILTVAGLICKWLDVRHACRKRERELDSEERSQFVRDHWVDIDIVPKKTCKHPDDKILPIHSDAFEKNGLVATLCLACDSQLGPEVWRDKMGRELAAFEKEQTAIEIKQKVADELATDSPETLYDYLERARAASAALLRDGDYDGLSTDWDAIKTCREVAEAYLGELTRRGLSSDRLLYDPPTKDPIKNELEFESAILDCETHILRAFGLPEPIQVKRAPKISFGMASDRNTISREYMPGVRPEGRPQEQYWSEFKAAGFMLKDQSKMARDGSVSQFLYHPTRGVHGIKFSDFRALERWLEL